MQDKLCILFVYSCQLKHVIVTYTRLLTSRYVWQPDVFDIHSIKLSLKDVENGHKWSWKVREYAHKKVLESRGKPRFYCSVCTVITAEVETLFCIVVVSSVQAYELLIYRVFSVICFISYASVRPDWQAKALCCQPVCLSICPSVRLFPNWWTGCFENDELILMQIGTSGPRGKVIKWSTSRVRRSKVKVTRTRPEMIWMPGGGVILDPVG